MVKYSITKEEFDALSPELKAEYKESGDAYKLDVSGIDAKAQDKLDGERSKRRDAEKKLRESEDAMELLKEGDDRSAIVAKADRDVRKAQGERDTAQATLLVVQKRNTTEKDANELATKLNPKAVKVILPHIMSRLDVDMTDPLSPKTVVLGLDGKPSGKTLDDLRAEFVANVDFAGIIVATSATGGAASRPGATGGSGQPSRPGAFPIIPGANRPDLGRMTATDLAAHVTNVRRSRGQDVAE